MPSDEEIRLERRGGAPDLPAAFTDFVKSSLCGRSLDDQHASESAQGFFPDFGVFRDLVLIEMKHLETDQQERIGAILDENISPDEKPIFYGQRKIDLKRDGISNADDIYRIAFSRLTRTIEGILSKANRQFESYRTRHPRKNAVNICVILNSKIMEYTPEVVVKAIHSKMRHSTRFSHIDSVLYISEKHFISLPDGRPAYPLAIYEGITACEHEWKASIINYIAQQWSWFRSGRAFEVEEGLREVGTVQDIPERISRSDYWLLEYERNPYLKSFDVAALRIHFHRLVALNSLAFLKGNWAKPAEEQTTENMRRLQHVFAETNRRGLDMRELDLRKISSSEREAVFADLPEELRDILLRKRPTSP